MLWWILTILLFLISVVSSTLLFYALRRINQYENFILNIENIINVANERIKRVDSSGHYESDDETSFFFEELKKIQLMLNNLFEPIEGDENAKKKEK